jgi:hypothetical protein
MRRIVAALVLVLIFLHQDYWWWDRIDPLVFGFLPIGLAWHVLLSILATVVYFFAVNVAWPKPLYDPDDFSPTRRQGPEL